MLGSDWLEHVHALLLPALEVLPQGGGLLCRPPPLPDRFPAELPEVLCPTGGQRAAAPILTAAAPGNGLKAGLAGRQVSASGRLLQRLAWCARPWPGADPLFCVEATMSSTGKAC